MTDQMVQGSVPAVQNQGKEVPVVNQIKSMLSTRQCTKEICGSPGKKAPQFMASITNTVAASKQLKQCPATSIIGQHLWRATYDLPIDSNLGFAAIVPYNENVYDPRTKQWKKVPKAQFQMMYKGFIQLAIAPGIMKR